MNKKEKIKLYFKKRPERVSFSGWTITLDWLFILFLGLAVLVTGIIYSVLLYLSISNGSAFKSDEISVPETLAEEKRSKIQQVITTLERR